MPTATGHFVVKLITESDDNPVGRRTIDKGYYGDLVAEARGQMLAMGSASGSAGYVAMEQVTGTLGGRAGTFVLMHRGVMHQGTSELLITVVPDSGTEELAGISGELQITVEDGEHQYSFEWSLAD